MLRLVAADPQVDGVAITVILLPHFPAGTFPAVRDRIADHQQIDISFLDSGIEALVTRHPPAVASIRRFDRRVLFGLWGRILGSLLSYNNRSRQQRNEHGQRHNRPTEVLTKHRSSFKWEIE